MIVAHAPSIRNYGDGADGALSGVKANCRWMVQNDDTVRIGQVDKDLSVRQIRQGERRGSTSQWDSARQSFVGLI
jgi:hypothetical protein